MNGILQNMQSLTVYESPPTMFFSDGWWLTSQIIKSVDISKSIDINQSITINHIYLIEVLNFNFNPHETHPHDCGIPKMLMII